MPYVLPPRYRFAHQYALFLHDLIAGLVNAGAEHRIFDVAAGPIPEGAEPPPPAGEEFYSWVERTYGLAATVEMDYKGIAHAVLRDFCDFTLEGLRASAKGKLTVAYALLRKPFKDNLFFLEWLLAEPADLITRFKTQSADALNHAKLGPGRRCQIIARAVSATNWSVPFDPSILHALRYDRAASYGMAESWDKATHLITTYKPIPTENQNLNFVFSRRLELDSQWERLYTVIPLLLYHAVEVAEALIGTFAAAPSDYLMTKRLRRQFGLIAWVESIPPTSEQLVQQAGEFRALLQEVPLHCPQCGQCIRFDVRNLRSYAVRGTVRCGACRSVTVTDQTNQVQGGGPEIGPNAG